jgi:Flp pilus assembly protein TadD
MLLLETGRYDESIRALEQALGLLPNDSWAHTCLGKAYLKRGETEKAAALFKKAIEFDPQDQRPVVELNQLTNPAPAPGTS